MRLFRIALADGDPAPVDREAALARAAAKDGEVDRLYEEGKVAEALAPAREALALREAALGADDEATVDSIGILVVLLRHAGRPKEARPLAERALAIRERTLGPDHPKTGESAGSLGQVLQALGHLRGARPHFERALAIHEKALGKDHEDTLTSVSNLAVLLHDQGDLAAARPLFERALAGVEKALGPDHPHALASLMNYAFVLKALGDPVAALPLFERAAAASERTLGPDHPGTAEAIGNVGLCLQDLGRLGEARARLERGLATTERALGPDHPATAVALNNLATLLQDLGDLAGARPLAERALAIQERALGPGHPATAAMLHNLAQLLAEMGDYEAARPPLVRAIAIAEKVLGPEHPRTALALNNLAAIELKRGDIAAARALRERALAIREKVLGPGHAETAESLNDLGVLEKDAGDLAVARTLLERAVAAYEKALGRDHPEVGKGLGNLAATLARLGDDEAARPLYERALAIHERTLGPDHPDTATGLANLAGLHRRRGDLAAARPLYERALAIRERAVDATFAAASERQRLALVRENRDALVGFLVAFEGDEARRLAAVLRWKGAVGRALAAERAAERERASPAVAAKLERLRALTAELARAYRESAGPGPGSRRAGAGGESRRDRLERLAKEREAVEVELARESAAFRRERGLAAASVDEVRAALPEEAALCEVLAFRGRYGAWVLAARGAAPPSFVDLGPEAEVEAAVAAVRRAIDERAPEAAFRAAAAGATARLFAPLRARLGDARTVILAPDGALAALPFAILPDSETAAGFLVETYTFGYVTSGTDLVRARAAAGAARGAGLLVVGGVDYGSSGVAGGAGGAAGSRRAFPPLPATAREAEAVAARFGPAHAGEPVHLLTGAAASEAAVKRLAPGRRHLHLATHGFSADGAGTGGGAPGTRGSATVSVGVAGVAEVEAAAGAERADLFASAMLRAGIALAGASLPPPTGDAPEDGILTAAEVAGLALDGTDLVVLSACETGLGEVRRGEGVLGLTRGFVLAGARTLVVSLWQVPDEATSALMDGFYAGVLAAKPAPPVLALRRAQQDLLAARRAKGDAAPWAWGGFIATGAP